MGTHQGNIAHRLTISMLLLVVALGGSLALVESWERALSRPEATVGPWRLLDYSSASAAAAPKPFTRSEQQGIITASYDFLAPGNRPLQLTLSLPTADYQRYLDQFGYRHDEIKALYREQQDRLDQAYKAAIRSGQPQAELDAVYAGIKADFHARTTGLILDRGFRFVDDSTLAADIPRIVSENTRRLRPVAKALLDAANRSHLDSQDVVAIALPFVQTALAYEVLPAERDGRLTAGFSPPLEVLLEGRGDCDSKTALLAAMLLNWDQIRLLGIGVPGHYLLGVLRVPARGDAFYEHDGLTYVLMEPAGPAWLPPGMIADSTLQRIGTGKVIVEPLTAH